MVIFRRVSQSIYFVFVRAFLRFDFFGDLSLHFSFEVCTDTNSNGKGTKRQQVPTKAARIMSRDEEEVSSAAPDRSASVLARQLLQPCIGSDTISADLLHHIPNLSLRTLGLTAAFFAEIEIAVCSAL